ncbi:DSPc-domain-containing protein [Calocera cornea HHB12733]|uniref:protein-tyrosine-phosphatase n=1 Tax=Calocera cornea HHB12733 TaxID=1353952 RepID=A0A165DM12_9BASI|nr:DSPc-domain-containing protein [Calocera cornea HHB12733]
MHQILPNLWLGDYRAAISPDLLAQHAIRYVLSALRWKPQGVQGVQYLHVEVDDTPDADLLAHLPACVRFIADALAAQQAVLVHCQAGVSRSATIVIAYLMSAHQLPADEALALVQQARPQASPSETFLAQLGLWREGGFKVSRRHKATRRFYLERTAEEVMNGDGSPVPLTMMASWPLTPSSSTPSTPLTAPKRRIRCHKCRRELATREHMLDHNVGPLTQPNTPGAASDGEGNPWDQQPRTSLSRPGSGPPSRQGSRRGSAVQGEKPLVAQLSLAMTAASASASASASPSASASAPGSEPQGTPAGLPPRRRSSASSPLAQELPVPSEALAAAPPLSTPTIPEDAVAPSLSPPGPAELRPAVRKPSLRRSFGTVPEGHDSAVSEDDDDPLPHLPHLRSATTSASTGPSTGPTSSSSPSTSTYFSPPILANPNCSGYFLEPMKWMDFLEQGEMGGAIHCPNKKCGAKLGNYDWAGVRCGCKEWIVPGFCIHKTKVDEDL